MKNNYTYRDACFICSSPYQVIGALGIQLNLHYDADLYILGSFPEFDILAKKIEHYDLFRNVISVDPSKIGSNISYRMVKEIFFARSTVNLFLPKNVVYGTFYFSSRSSLKAALLKVLSDRNPEMKRIVFEDGMGTYSDSAHLLSVSKSRKIIEKALFWHIDDPQKTSIIAYMPELIHYPEPFEKCAIEQMQRLPLDDSTKRMMCDLFSIKNGSEIREKYIIFDTKRWDRSKCDIAQLQILDQCYEIVLKHAGTENVILKPHPRSTTESANSITIYPNQGVPMEAIYAVMPDMKDRILISFVSSAVFTPKILFDEEPVVICLHRIVGKNKISELFADIFEKFRNTYRHPEYVQAPASFEELDCFLQSLADARSNLEK